MIRSNSWRSSLFRDVPLWAASNFPVRIRSLSRLMVIFCFKAKPSLYVIYV